MTMDANGSSRAPEGDAAELDSKTERGMEFTISKDAATQPCFEPLLIEEGLELIRLKPESKEPAGKWRDAQALTRAEASKWVDQSGNLGVRLGDLDLVIDADPRNYLAGDDPLARLIADFKLPNTWTVQTGGGGTHLYLQLPNAMPVKAKLKGYQGIDFKNLGGYVVAPGSIHPDTGKAYVLEYDPLDPDGIAEAPTELIAALRKADVVETTEPGDLEPEQLHDLLAHLDPTDFQDQDDWLALMMACHHGTNGAGMEEFVAWSTGDPDYADHDEKIRSRWRSLTSSKSGAVTVRTLYKWVNDAGGGADIPRTSAQQDFADQDEVIDCHDDSPSERALKEMNATNFTVLHGGRFMVGREKIDPMLGHFTVDWCSDEAFRKHANVKHVDVGNGELKKRGTWWTAHPRRRQYDGVVFDPTPGREHSDLYNLWRGWSVRPKKGDWSLIQRLIKDVLCAGSDEGYSYLIRWMAYMVQSPQKPAEVAVVLKGKKGVGKGTLGRALRAIAGKHGKQVSQPEHFIGKFNEHLMDCILLFVDEGFWAGDKKAEGALKNLITEPVLTFEPKGKPIVSGPNMLHVMIASNEDWVVPATADERRFCVFEVDEQAHAALPAGFFADLNKGIENGSLLAGMLDDLLTTDLEGWSPRDGVPQTSALIEQKVEGLARTDPIAAWWLRTLQSGELGITIHSEDWSSGPVLIEGGAAKGDVLGDLNISLRRRAPEFTMNALAKALSRWGVDIKQRTREGKRCWTIPKLDQARSEFSKWIGGDLDWD